MSTEQQLPYQSLMDRISDGSIVHSLGTFSSHAQHSSLTMENPYEKSFFQSCLCFMATTLMFTSMILIGLRFSHVLPHHKTEDNHTEMPIEIREAETERREETVEEEEYV